MQWDLEVDSISVGSGIGGLSAAIAAASGGLRALVLEKSPKVGGVTAYSFGELWLGANHLEADLGIEDSPEETLRYMRFLGAGFGDERMQRLYVSGSGEALRFFERTIGLRVQVVRNFSDYYYPSAPGSKPEGRFLEPEPFDARQLGEWRERTRLSPHVPYGLTHEEMFSAGGAGAVERWDFETMGRRLQEDIRCLGPALAGWFVKGALDAGADLRLESAAARLIVDDGRVVGVEARTSEGDLRIRATRGVVLATGAYDWNPQFVRFYEQLPEKFSAVPPSVEGDHLTMAGAAGAMLAAIPPSGSPKNLGIHIPGEEHDGKPLYRIVLVEQGLPHAIVVNASGRRIGDESFYRSLGSAVTQFDGREQRFVNLPAWLVIDQNHRDRYAIGSLLPGQDLPRDFAVRGDTLAEVAAGAGIDAAGLEDTVERFNRFAEEGLDPEYRRGGYRWSNYMCGDSSVKPNPNLAPLSKPPFYAIRLHPVSAGVAAAGLKVDERSRVLDVRGAAIEGLYAAGNSVAFVDIGAGYQSGMANTRGMMYGYLAAQAMLGR